MIAGWRPTAVFRAFSGRAPADAGRFRPPVSASVAIRCKAVWCSSKRRIASCCVCIDLVNDPTKGKFRATGVCISE